MHTVMFVVFPHLKAGRLSGQHFGFGQGEPKKGGSLDS